MYQEAFIEQFNYGTVDYPGSARNEFWSHCASECFPEGPIMGQSSLVTFLTEQESNILCSFHCKIFFAFDKSEMLLLYSHKEVTKKVRC